MTTKLNANYYNEKLSIKLGPLVKVRFRSARYYRHDERIVYHVQQIALQLADVAVPREVVCCHLGTYSPVISRLSRLDCPRLYYRVHNTS